MTGYEGLITQLLEDPAHNAMKAAAVIRFLVKDTFRWKEAAHDISDEGEWVLWKDIAQAKEHLRTEAARAEIRKLNEIDSLEANIDALKSRIYDLQSRISDLQSRISELEDQSTETTK
jgi:predicted  nucleic acid-binding Zn-ribbon protein